MAALVDYRIPATESHRLRRAADQGASEATARSDHAALWRRVDRANTARATARMAIRVLVNEGLVTAEHGRGVFVRSLDIGSYPPLLRPPVQRPQSLSLDGELAANLAAPPASWLASEIAIGAAPSRTAIQHGAVLPWADRDSASGT